MSLLGNQYGVAKGVTVRNIRVDDRDHFWSQWVAAICTAVNDYATVSSSRAGILNLSLGIKYTAAPVDLTDRLNKCLKFAVSKGMIVVAAAGNTGNGVNLSAPLTRTKTLMIYS
jgi:subtilisin family serine protease